MQFQMDRIEAKDKEIITLKVKYAQVKTLLESHGVIMSGLSRDTSIIGASGNDNCKVRYRNDTISSGGSCHP